MQKNTAIQIGTDKLELDIEYEIDSEQTKIIYFGITGVFYWHPDGTFDDTINPDHIRELMDTINRSMFSASFTKQILMQIPPLLHQKKRTDLAAVAMDWLSQYHMDLKNTMLL